MKQVTRPHQNKEPSHRSNMKGMSIRIRLLVLMLVSMFLLCTGFLVVLLLSGTMSVYKNLNTAILQNETSHMQNEMNRRFLHWNSDCMLFNSNVTEQIQTVLNEQNVSAADLRNNVALQELVLRREYENCIDTLYRSDCSGVFIVLNNASDSDERIGMYLRGTPEYKEIDAPIEYQLHNGPIEIAEEYGIKLYEQWTKTLSAGQTPYYNNPLNAIKNEPFAVSSSYYWSFSPEHTEFEPNTILCSAPLVDTNGNVYGVCGIAIEEPQFQSEFEIRGLTLGDICCILFRETPNGILETREAAQSGNLLFAQDCTMQIEKNGDGCIRYRSEEDQSIYCGYQLPISLYGSTSFFANEHWMVSVMVPKRLIANNVFGYHLKLIILLSVLILSGTLLAVYVSKRWTDPILEGLDTLISEADDSETIRIPEIDEVRKYLSEHREELSANEKESFSSALIDTFFENLKTLSPAERLVFNLYVKGCTAKKIAEKLSLSINTIKTHNKRIYMKLNVNSRDELLLYVRLLREAGERLD